jgi:hypothetical protein
VVVVVVAMVVVAVVVVIVVIVVLIVVVVVVVVIMSALINWMPGKWTHLQTDSRKERLCNTRQGILCHCRPCAGMDKETIVGGRNWGVVVVVGTGWRGSWYAPCLHTATNKQCTLILCLCIVIVCTLYRGDTAMSASATWWPDSSGCTEVAAGKTLASFIWVYFMGDVRPKADKTHRVTVGHFGVHLAV